MVNLDISDRKQLELALKQQRDFVQRLTDDSPQLIYIFDWERQQITYTNRQMNELLERSLGATAPIKADNFARIWHPQDWRILKSTLQTIARLPPGEGRSLELRVNPPSGGERWLQLRMGVFEQDREAQSTKLLITAIDISDRKALELELQASEAQLNQVLDSAIAAIVRFHFYEDCSVTYIYCSEGAQAVYGHAATAFLEDSNLWFSQVHPDDFTNLISPNFPKIFAEESFHLEYRFYAADGSIRWISDTIKSQRSPEENCWIVTAVATDITDQKRAESDLIESYQIYEELVNSVDGIVWEFQLHTQKFTFVSQQAELILGYPIEQWYNEPHFWEDHIHPEDRSWVVDYCFQETQQHRSHDFEYRMLAADGRVVWLRDIVNVVIDHGRPSALRGLMIDITADKDAENQLRRYERIVSATPDGVALIDKNYIYQIVNQTYLDWNDRQREHIEGHSVAELLGQKVFQNIVKPKLDQALSGEIIRYQEWFTYPNIGPQFIQVTYAPYYVSEQQAAGVVVTTRNISDLKRAEIALQKQAAEDCLLASITNHIRASLNLQQILDAVVMDVRQYLQVNRVFVYRCSDDLSGQVIAESLEPPWPSALGQVITQNCSLEVVRVSQQKQNNDVHIASNVDQADLSASYRAMLSALQVRANLVLPILDNQRIWGRLEAQHCAAVRPWQPEEVSFLQRLCDQLAIAIQQSELYEQLRAANQQLYYLANHDQLTEIANRRHFDEYLEQEWKRLARDQSPLSLIICDVDYFKPYNDTYGHPAGDTCLVQIAQVLAQSARRPADLAARYGGEEFALILPDTDVAGAVQLVTLIQTELQRLHLPHQASPIAQAITLSFGIASDRPTVQSHVQGLIDRADAALYQAKQSGRNRYVIATS